MKDAALRHLMLLSGRAVATVHADERARVDEVCTSLTVTAVGRGAYRLDYRLGGEPLVLDIAPKRFEFYRRGDVASLNERRAADLDLRTTNWHAAMTTWSEILGRGELASSVTVRAILPATSQGADLAARLLGAAGAAGALALVGLAARHRWGGVFTGAVATALAAVAADGRTRPTAGVAGAVAAAVAGRRPVQPLGLAGAAALAVYAADLPARGTALSPAMLPARFAAAAVAGASGPGFASAASVAASADAIGAALGRDRSGVRSSLAPLGVVLATRLAMRRWRPGPATTVSGSVGAAIATGLVVENVVRSMEGMRSRLAPLVVPVALGVATVSRSDRRTATALGAGLLAAAASGRLITLMAPTASSATPAATLPASSVSVSTPVTVRPVRAAARPVDETPRPSGERVDADGAEVATSS